MRSAAAGRSVSFECAAGDWAREFALEGFPRASGKRPATAQSLHRRRSATKLLSNKENWYSWENSSWVPRPHGLRQSCWMLFVPPATRARDAIRAAEQAFVRRLASSSRIPAPSSSTSLQHSYAAKSRPRRVDTGRPDPIRLVFPGSRGTMVQVLKVASRGTGEC